MKKEGTKALPMIEFAQVAEKIDFEGCDTLMFTSKQAVLTADRIDPKWKNFPSIAIGPATKMQIEKLGGRVMFHPEKFYGETLAEEIAEFFRDRRILYLRPRKVTFDSRGFLASKGIILREQVIYETSCIRYGADKRPPDSSVIIFTSPSTIDCFLQNFGWHPGYTAVVIGKSTLKHLPPGADSVIADFPLIDACVEKAYSVAISS